MSIDVSSPGPGSRSARHMITCWEHVPASAGLVQAVEQPCFLGRAEHRPRRVERLGARRRAVAAARLVAAILAPVEQAELGEPTKGDSAEELQVAAGGTDDRRSGMCS